MDIFKWEYLKDLLKNRFILFLFYLIVFVVINYCFSKTILPSPETKNLWFYSGVFMVLFSILFIEPYYSSPKNVITNTVPLLLVFLAIGDSFENKTFWWAAIIVILLLVIFSVIAITLQDKNKSPNDWKNKLSEMLKKFVVSIGRGKVLYSSVFICFLLTYHSIQNYYTVLLFVLWFFILSINPEEINTIFSPKKNKDNKNAIGEIFGVQSKKIFLVRLFEDRKNVEKFDVVKFKYSMQDKDNLAITGIVFDSYLLNQEKWVKILQLKELEEERGVLNKNIVYKVSIEIKTELEKDLNINNFVGIVIEGSDIGKIKFEYSKQKEAEDVQEGDLLELKIGKKRLFYQVINGITEIEKLEFKNETGFIEGEAMQLGEWQNEKFSFQKYGWVPSINTPIFKADTTNIEIQKCNYPDYELGKIPNTSLPSIINLEEAVSHHMALLGVTGSGKSFLAHEIIEQLKKDTKIICVDFNKEFISTLKTSPLNIINENDLQDIFSDIDWINTELGKFANQQNTKEIDEKKKKIDERFKTNIKSFMEDTESNIVVFELPDVTNSRGILDYTKSFFSSLFKVAKEYQQNKENKKISIILEEAHTIIPEWNFAGSSDKTSQSLVNSIGQIALQGRKYKIGFLVIAQRTANVSKTVLTQCNTVVCFQAFDETSFAFLGNYIGKDLVQALPNLKQYHAVVTGKAVKSNIPMIIDLERK